MAARLNSRFGNIFGNAIVAPQSISPQVEPPPPKLELSQKEENQISNVEQKSTEETPSKSQSTLSSTI